MLTETLREELIKTIKDDPKEAIKIIEKEPEILKLLLNNQDKAKQEKIKYINMNMQMEKQLQETAKRLNTTQGILIGAGVLWFLSMMDK